MPWQGTFNCVGSSSALQLNPRAVRARTSHARIVHPDAPAPATLRMPTPAELALAEAMLSSAGPDARAFLPQLAAVQVARACSCGCASLDFWHQGHPAPAGPVQVLGDYVFGPEAAPVGAMIFARGGQLAGIEIYGLAGEPPATLPAPQDLRPIGSASTGHEGARSN